MSSGSYLPPPVRAVEIPKPHGGGVRMLGVPTIADRVAQTVVAMYLEERADHRFHPDSYGYRPGKSAHDALSACRQRCWKYDWVIDLDVQKFFDELPWDVVVQTGRGGHRLPLGAVVCMSSGGWPPRSSTRMVPLSSEPREPRRAVWRPPPRDDAGGPTSLHLQHSTAGDPPPALGRREEPPIAQLLAKGRVGDVVRTERETLDEQLSLTLVKVLPQRLPLDQLARGQVVAAHTQLGHAPD
jgi:Reverse transcriptase (RNA-dependent DNA polymerase)